MRLSGIRETAEFAPRGATGSLVLMPNPPDMPPMLRIVFDDSGKWRNWITVGPSQLQSIHCPDLDLYGV